MYMYVPIIQLFLLILCRKRQVSFPKYMAMLAAVLAFEAVFFGYGWVRSYPLDESQLYLNEATNTMHILDNDDVHSNGSTSSESWEMVRVVNNIDLVRSYSSLLKQNIPS